MKKNSRTKLKLACVLETVRNLKEPALLVVNGGIATPETQRPPCSLGCTEPL